MAIDVMMIKASRSQTATCDDRDVKKPAKEEPSTHGNGYVTARRFC
jgi:hypothetical protein